MWRLNIKKILAGSTSAVVINLVYLAILIFIFTSMRPLWTAFVMWFIMTAGLVCWRFFLTEDGLAAIGILRTTVEHYKLKKKLEKDGQLKK